MISEAEITDEAIFTDTSQTIGNALRRSYETNSSHLNISKTAFEIALSQLI
jgi:hypothetical protein